MIKTIKTTDVVFREDLYPRIETSAVTVQKYAEDLSVLPPIEVNQHNELIDGWHRWTAHKKAQADTIQAVVTETRGDVGILELAIERNATHGLQLSQSDKQTMARKIYSSTPDKDRQAKKVYLARILSVSEKTVQRWLSRIDKDTRDAARKTAFAMWLGCRTQEEIAEAIGYDRTAISKMLKDSGFVTDGQMSENHETADYLPIWKSRARTGSEDENEDGGDDATGLGTVKLTKAQVANADHADEQFESPVYNVWKQQKKTHGSSHYGNSEVRWLDNLLYLYTKPFDVVVDPFAGGGSTIDICKRRLRRYWASDRKPIVERQNEIRQHDLVHAKDDGTLQVKLPPLPRWKDVALVYLDPPYWKQAEHKYSKDSTDLANMDLDTFHKVLAHIINAFGDRRRLSGAHIALLISPTQYPAPDHQYTDHVAEMLRRVKLPVDMRYSCPYESQQYNGKQVEWAKTNKKCLVLTRELIVWRVE